MVWCFVHNSRNPFSERGSHFEVHSGNLTWTRKKIGKGVFLSDVWSLIFMLIFDGLDQQKKAIRHQPAHHIKHISSNPEVFYTMDPCLECRPWHVAMGTALEQICG